MNLRMSLWSLCSRFFEPVRDVSFINNMDERILIQDFINACDMACAWPSIRSGQVDSLRSEIEYGLIYKHDFDLMIQIMGHMATNWEDWVINRKAIQEKELSDATALANWVSKYKWNSNANNVLLLAYMENLLSLDDKLDASFEKVLFELEISLARKPLEEMESYKNYLCSVGNTELFEESMEYKLEICKIVTAIPLPSTYKFTKERWNKNKEYIDSCESMKKILGDLQTATLNKNADELRKAIDFGINYPSITSTDIFMDAEDMLEILSVKSVTGV